MPKNEKLLILEREAASRDWAVPYQSLAQKSRERRPCTAVHTLHARNWG